MLELYQIENCPHCTKVRQRLSEWEIDYIARNVPEELAKRTQLMKVSGQVSVPTLVDSAREVTVLGDEQKILDYLDEFYRPRSSNNNEEPADPRPKQQSHPDFKGYG